RRASAWRNPPDTRGSPRFGATSSSAHLDRFDLVQQCLDVVGQRLEHLGLPALARFLVRVLADLGDVLLEALDVLAQLLDVDLDALHVLLDALQARGLTVDAELDEDGEIDRL